MHKSYPPNYSIILKLAGFRLVVLALHSPSKANPVRQEADPPDFQHRPRPVLKDAGLAFLDPLLRGPARSRVGHAFPRNRTGFPRIPPGLSRKYFRPVNRTKMFLSAGTRQAEQ